MSLWLDAHVLYPVSGRNGGFRESCAIIPDPHLCQVEFQMLYSGDVEALSFLGYLLAHFLRYSRSEYEFPTNVVSRKAFPSRETYRKWHCVLIVVMAASKTVKEDWDGVRRRMQKH